MKFFFTFSVVFLIVSTFSFSQTIRENSQRLKKNVVVVESKLLEETYFESKGFGFIIGEQGGDLFIATAAHIVLGETYSKSLSRTETIIRFSKSGESIKAEPINMRYSHNKDDVLFLRIRKPFGKSWDKKVESSKVFQSREVTVIGREQDPSIVLGAGAITKINGNKINADVGGVVVGCSGAPLIDCLGIIGIVTSDEFGTVRATSLKRIKKMMSEGGYSKAYGLEAAVVQLLPQEKTFPDFVPIASQFRRGKNEAGTIIAIGLVGGTLTGLYAQTQYTKNSNDAQTALNISDQLAFMDRAEDWRLVRNTAVIATGALALLAFLDGAISDKTLKDGCACLETKNLKFDLAFDQSFGVGVKYTF